MCFSAHIAESEIQLHSTGFSPSFSATAMQCTSYTNVQCAICNATAQCASLQDIWSQCTTIDQSYSAINSKHLVTECRVAKKSLHILAFHRPTSPDPCR